MQYSHDEINNLVHDYFDFLLEKSFETSDIRFSDDVFNDWIIIFRHKICLLEIYSDRKEVDAVFVISNKKENLRLGITHLVYFLSHGKDFTGSYKGDLKDQEGQIKWLTEYLKKYTDQALMLFENDISMHKKELQDTGKIVFQLIRDEFKEKRKQAKRT